MDETEVSQGSDPVNSLDRGEVPSADARIKLRLSVGDQTKLYAEGRMSGTSLVTVTFETGDSRVTDTVSLTVQPYPATMDVDIDSDNNNDVAQPARSEWEETLEDHDYGIGKHGRHRRRHIVDLALDAGRLVRLRPHRLGDGIP